MVVQAVWMLSLNYWSLFYFVLISLGSANAISECVALAEDLSTYNCHTREERITRDLLCEDTDERCAGWKDRGK